MGLVSWRWTYSRLAISTWCGCVDTVHAGLAALLGGTQPFGGDPGHVKNISFSCCSEYNEKWIELAFSASLWRVWMISMLQGRAVMIQRQYINKYHFFHFLVPWLLVLTGSPWRCGRQTYHSFGVKESVMRIKTVRNQRAGGWSRGNLEIWHLKVSVVNVFRFRLIPAADAGARRAQNLRPAKGQVPELQVSRGSFAAGRHFLGFILNQETMMRRIWVYFP